MYRVLICCILSQNHNLPHRLMCGLLFKEFLGLFQCIFVSSFWWCVLQILAALVFSVSCLPSLLKLVCIYLSSPSVQWNLLNVPRQKVQASHLISSFCQRSQSCDYCCLSFGYICFTYFVKFFIHSRRVIPVPVLCQSCKQFFDSVLYLVPDWQLLCSESFWL